MSKVETRKSTRVVSSKKVKEQINKILSVDSDEALGLRSVAFLDSFKGDQEEEEFESDLDETLNALVVSFKGDQEEEEFEENSYLNQYLKFLSTHNSMKGAYMYGSTLFIDAYVRKARNIPRPPPREFRGSH